MEEHNLPLEYTEDLDAVLNRILKAKEEAEKFKAKPIIPGELNPRDVCRLFIGPEWSHPWMDGPATAAHRVIAEKNLPLIEVKPNRWQVAHVVNW